MPPGVPKPRVGIVLADAVVRGKIAAALRADNDVFEGEDYTAAFVLLQETDVDILLLGMPLPSGGVSECVELLQRLDGSEIDTLVIVLSEDTKRSAALKVIEAGSYDYFILPIDMEVLRMLITRGIEKLLIQRENRILRDEIRRKDSLGDLIGSTDAMRHLFSSIQRMARSNANVVIRGESGTGKELVARALHDQGPRRTKPFIGVNCAALPESLMEAELFGYERGAFTGAVVAKEGRIELAEGGTLFLDEIATLTPPLQSKLLRVLEERALTRLGGKKAIKLNFRLVSATNENLEEMAKQGKFREDLYYRIHVVPIFVPPLRERSDDVPLLVDYFIQVYCAANQVPKRRVANDALAALQNYRWPGNVRELSNVVQRLVLMTDANKITLKDLPPNIARNLDSTLVGPARLPAGGIDLNKEIEAYERKWVEATLAQSKGSKVEAARLLGIDKNRMNYLCRKHRL
jgi:DNA-binding NtrC family response regulator